MKLKDKLVSNPVTQMMGNYLNDTKNNKWIEVMKSLGFSIAMFLMTLFFILIYLPKWLIEKYVNFYTPLFYKYKDRMGIKF